MHRGSQALQCLSPGHPSGQEGSLNSVVSSRSCRDLVPRPETGNLVPSQYQLRPLILGQRVLELPKLFPTHLTCPPPHPCEEGKAGLGRKQAQRG